MSKQISKLTTNEVTLLRKGHVTTPQGFSAGGLHCGIRKSKLDLGWIVSEVPAVTVGVYTTNQFQAAPLQVTQESIAYEHKIQALLVNSGVANACTGEQGLEDAYTMRQLFSDALGITKHHVAVASTGLIGVPLPLENIEAGINNALEEENQAVTRFESAILTTDTREKGLAVQIEIDGKTVTIGGAAKGSGMIHPNMATMLSFVTTDAEVDQADLSDALKQVTDKSFNMITVDGDTRDRKSVV